MKVLSLFDGVSCARVALERAGIPVEEYYASEIDKYAIQISQKNYPDIIRLGDVKNVNGKDFENIDLLIAGFPCQSFSIAGKRRGLEDERGKLVYDLIRILKEVKPKHIILENVASMKKEIQEYLREEFEKATGRKVYINKINASLVSAQNRNRIFFCFQEIPQPEDRGILLKDILESNVDEKYNVSLRHTQAMINTRKSKKLNIPEENGKSGTITASYYKIPNDGVYIKRIGQIGKGGQGDRIYSPDGKSVGLSALGGGRGAKTGLYEVNGAARRTYPRYKIEGQTREKQIEIRTDGKANAMTKSTEDIMVSTPQIRKLTPVECERLQSLPEVEKSCIIKVCLDHQNNYVSAENKNLKSQSVVGNVEKKDLKENVLSAKKNLNTKNLPINKPVQPE